MRQPLIDDLNSDLPDVQRAWLRRPAVMLLFPLVLTLALLVGVWNALLAAADFVRDCW